MLQTLSTELNNMQAKSKQQVQRIENLYIGFQEIYQLSNNLNNPGLTKHDMLSQVRPEVFNQILIFLDIKQILQFRLVSSRAKETVKLILPKYIDTLQSLIAEQQNDIQIKFQSIQQADNDQNQQQAMQAALDGLARINKSHIVELKSFARPHELVEKVINLICQLLDPSFKVQKDNWKECQKFLNQSNFISQIINLDISILSDKQLQQLEQVNSISEQQARAISIVANSILNYLKAVLEVRQTKVYMTQKAIKELNSKIKKEQQLVDQLEKIINK
ncbi:unnamed protein product (macronuclear) [Paramecium tetraurelia]|uniref:Uncharacterized protein n=1 Tax=Paramecium tetraurelia TaxID=5888 RepID=A0BN57_PARTE|nr:uncharacterized protein GSPATT00030612001 [Paramecium tetraurelia]CAK59974.1 unnamed protein product [Paramecium tetraurelia]|eukprot:XP_001427372.1 hypothetical protein (macronuclear) [Paramecium tetraurelia strain d4-2]